ncbi:uncharacterized protein A4U43_C07F38680 [Asparagus officinalis]|uniref:Inhibitor I9 domain-containing protein n=1 Tax=Asparagus officinalis TaxID=4686 RepID=A0A5P1EIM8_ASPOF|nr:subtilisin-like protease SBT3.12 [Asparagus officinalis]ONK65593.1 uncharacterized protein A4U43_C07F38680 [Asparagus officinalis]
MNALVSSFLFLFFLFSSNLCQFVISINQNDTNDDLKTYIIQVAPPKNAHLDQNELRKWYRSFLPNNSEEFARSRIIYDYDTALTGFAVRLTPKELKEVEKKEGFLGAYPDSAYHLDSPNIGEGN